MAISGIAPMTYAGFTSIPNGTQVKNYGFDQCVAVANLYHQGVLGLTLPSGFGSAHQWWTQFGNQPNLYSNYRQSASPVAGALFVAKGGIYNFPDGHIGQVTDVYPDGSFATIEQNAGTWRYLGRYRRTKTAGILGFLIPKQNPATKPTPAGQEEDEEMAQRQAVCHTENGVQTVIIGESSTGWKFKYRTTATNGRNPENEKWARVFETGDFVSVTDRSMLDAWEQSLDEKRQGK